MRDLKDYVSHCMKALDNIGIRYGNIVEVKVNTRAIKRWGRCRKVVGGYVIEIGSVLLDERNDEHGLKETIFHELLHSCKDCMNHGTNWKRLADKVNMLYGYNIKRCTSAEEVGVQPETRPVKVSEPKYAVRCNECGCVYERTKRSSIIQHPERYRCGRCGGALSSS